MLSLNIRKIKKIEKSGKFNLLYYSIAVILRSDFRIKILQRVIFEEKKFMNQCIDQTGISQHYRNVICAIYGFNIMSWRIL